MTLRTLWLLTFLFLSVVLFAWNQHPPADPWWMFRDSGPRPRVAAEWLAR